MYNHSLYFKCCIQHIVFEVIFETVFFDFIGNIINACFDGIFYDAVQKGTPRSSDKGYCNPAFLMVLFQRVAVVK